MIVKLNTLVENLKSQRYATINGLLKKSPKVLPALDCSDQALANNKFLTLFIEKVDKVRANVNVSTSDQRRVVSISDVTINKDVMTDSHFPRFFGVVVNARSVVKVVLCIIFENIVILSGVHS